MTDLLRGQFTSDTVSRHFDDAALLAALARFEAGLAGAQADAGIVPRAAADAIGRVCAARFGRQAVGTAPGRARRPARCCAATGSRWRCSTNCRASGRCARCG